MYVHPASCRPSVDLAATQAGIASVLTCEDGVMLGGEGRESLIGGSNMPGIVPSGCDTGLSERTCVGKQRVA
ncbi:MAG: hypothetical protein QOI44_1391 [Actinomycetota bacterium]|jgi:hypothetical protein|nr:hypothetical protein [Actinomycetota bacterium]